MQATLFVIVRAKPHGWQLARYLYLRDDAPVFEPVDFPLMTWKEIHAKYLGAVAAEHGPR